MRKFTTVLMVFLLSAFQLFAQNKTISGKVTDERGAGIQGASVTAKGSTKGAVTSADGSFTLSVAQTVKQIIVSHKSFESQTITIPANGVVNVKLESSKEDLREVEVNTGLNTYKKKHYNGAVHKITEREISNQPVGSLDQLLQGRAPGVLALSGSGQPGTSANIIIRGSASVLGGSSPLYIVDGIQVEEGVFQGINPNDFASMEILRDAAGTALYGNRGSAGVIVVTTKRGQTGKVRVSYSAQFGQKDRPAFTYDMMNARQLLQAQEQYGYFLQNNGGTANIQNALGNLPGWHYSALNDENSILSPSELAENKRILDSLGGINTNWRDVFFRKGSFSNHQLDITGGIGKAAFRSSIGFYNEEGITLRTDMKRVTWRNNFDYKDEKLTFQFNSALGYTTRNFQQSSTSNSLGNPFLVSNLAAPYTQVYNSDGTVAVGPTSEAQLNRANSRGYNFGFYSNRFVAANTLDLTNRDENYNAQFKATTNLLINYNLFKNTTLGLIAGFDYRETQGSNYGSRLAFTRVSAGTPTGVAGFQSETSGRYFNPTVRTSINWKKTFKDKHDLDLTLLSEYLQINEKSISLTGFGIDPKTPNTPAAITQGNGTNNLFAQVGGGKTQRALASGLFIARYTFDDKITITGSYRRDGASNLPANTRWQDFYSISAGWDLKKSAFLSSSRNINSLKIKFSYGNAGNFNNFPFSDFYFIPTWGANGQYNAATAYNPASPGNPRLKWEFINTANLGIDFELFKNRLYGDINIYDRRTKDMFIPVPLSIPASSVYGAEIQNNQGTLLNKGIELSLNYALIKTRNTTLTLFTNFAYNRNQVLDLGPGVTSFEQGTELVTVGKPLGSHFDNKWGGVDAATGRPLYYDINGKLTTEYRASDRVQEFGTWEAPFKGGFGTRLTHKGFDFNILFTFQDGAYKSNNLEYFVENPVGFMNFGYNQANTMRFWQKPGDVVSTPSPLYTVNFTSKLIHSSSFIRLREVSMGYRLPQSSIDKLKFLKGARFFILANNLYLWTNWIGLDPEAGATNINLSEFPNPKTFTMGVEVNF